MSVTTGKQKLKRVSEVTRIDRIRNRKSYKIFKKIADDLPSMSTVEILSLMTKILTEHFATYIRFKNSMAITYIRESVDLIINEIETEQYAMKKVKRPKIKIEIND